MSFDRGEFPVSVFNMVLNGSTLKGSSSMAETRAGLEEALAFATEET
jgi:hypothetical protein